MLPQQDSKTRYMLESLANRVEAIAQPLNYCILWAEDKGTCTSNVIFQARKEVEKVEHFVRECALKVQAKQSIGEQTSTTESIKHYIAELDFAISSVTLAVSVINSSQQCSSSTSSAEASSLFSSSSSSSSSSFSSLSVAGPARCSHDRGRFSPRFVFFWIFVCF